MVSTPPRKRVYRSALRKEQAEQTRRRILHAAGECFSVKGYGGTSLADIAAKAGVSVELVKTSGPKRSLLLGAFEQAFAGNEGRESLAERSSMQEILHMENDDEFLSAAVEFLSAANERTIGIWRALRSAANSDHAVAEAFDDLLERRARDYRLAIDAMHRRGMLPSGADHRHLAEVLCFLLSSESLEQLVLQSDWSRETYQAWIVHSIRRLVLEP